MYLLPIAKIIPNVPPCHEPEAALRYFPQRIIQQIVHKNNTEYPHCQHTYLPIYLNHKPPSRIHIPKKLTPGPPLPKMAHSTPAISKEPPASNPQPNESHQAQSSKPHALPPPSPPLPSPPTHCRRLYKVSPFSKTSISTPSPSSSISHPP